MSLVWQARSKSAEWSSPVAVWWMGLSLVAAVNIAAWVYLYRTLPGTSANAVMLALCAAYVFGCAFRSVLPRADIQRICLFDTWLCSVTIGRTIATIAELAFVAQWALLLHRMGTTTGADTAVYAALVIVPIIVIAEVFSWYAVLTRNYLYHAIENSLWAVAFFIIAVGLVRLLPEFDGVVRLSLVAALTGIAGYIAFLVTVDVPMYVTRWRADIANGTRMLRPLEGLRDATVRRVVTREMSEWRDEIPWMSLYFSGAVWGSLVICVVYAMVG
jgi:hypothetical protein